VSATIRGPEGGGRELVVAREERVRMERERIGSCIVGFSLEFLKLGLRNKCVGGEREG